MTYALIEGYSDDPSADARMVRMDRHLGLVTVEAGGFPITAQNRVMRWRDALREHYGQAARTRVVSTFQNLRAAVDYLERVGRHAVMETPDLPVTADPLAYRENAVVNIGGRQTERVSFRHGTEIVIPPEAVLERNGRTLTVEELQRDMHAIADRHRDRAMEAHTAETIQEQVRLYLRNLRDIGAIVPVQDIQVTGNVETGELSIVFIPNPPVARVEMRPGRDGLFEATMHTGWDSPALPDVHFDLASGPDTTVAALVQTGREQADSLDRIMAVIGSNPLGPVPTPVLVRTLDDFNSLYGNAPPPPTPYAAPVSSPKRRLKL